MPIKFHLDESVHEAVAIGLKRRGVNVTTSLDAKLLGATDIEQLAFAAKEDRVFVTCDVDFLRIAKLETSHSGILYFHNQKKTVGQVVNRLLRLQQTHMPKMLNNCVEFI